MCEDGVKVPEGKTLAAITLGRTARSTASPAVTGPAPVETPWEDRLARHALSPPRRVSLRSTPCARSVPYLLLLKGETWIGASRSGCGLHLLRMSQWPWTRYAGFQCRVSFRKKRWEKRSSDALLSTVIGPCIPFLSGSSIYSRINPSCVGSSHGSLICESPIL